MNRLQETGWISGVEGDEVRVKTVQSSSCAQCQARAGCGQSLLDGWMSNVGEFVLPAGGQHLTIGQKVTLSVAPDAVAKSALMVYLIPLGAMIAALLAAMALTSAEYLHAGAAALGFALGALLVRQLSDRLQRNPAYAPRLETGEGESAVQLIEHLEHTGSN